MEMRDAGEEFPLYLRPQRVGRGGGSLEWLGGFSSMRAGLVCREQLGRLLGAHCPFRDKAWALSISWDQPWCPTPLCAEPQCPDRPQSPKKP